MMRTATLAAAMAGQQPRGSSPVPTNRSAERHYCRNARCRSKLVAPVENLHRAFCCRGCFEQFYRTRCLVCETPKHHQRRLLCGHIKCRREKSRFPHLFVWSAPTLAETAKPIAEVPVLSALKWLSGALRGFAWEQTDCDTYTLHHRDGTARAVVRRAEQDDCWWVARPRAVPEPPVEPLAAAQRRAVDFALWTLPLDSKKKQVARKPSAAAIFQRNALPRNLLGGLRFDDAQLDRDLVKTITRTESRLCEPLPFVSSPGIVPVVAPDADDPLAVPQFLIRVRQAVKATVT